MGERISDGLKVWVGKMAGSRGKAVQQNGNKEAAV